jgi:hypothetical protein
MASNLDKYKADLEKVELLGSSLLQAMIFETEPDRYTKIAKSVHKEKANEYLRSLPRFKTEYQKWYSECLVLVKQIIPDLLICSEI